LDSHFISIVSGIAYSKNGKISKNSFFSKTGSKLKTAQNIFEGPIKIFRCRFLGMHGNWRYGDFSGPT